MRFIEFIIVVIVLSTFNFCCFSNALATELTTGSSSNVGNKLASLAVLYKQQKLQKQKQQLKQQEQEAEEKAKEEEEDEQKQKEQQEKHDREEIEKVVKQRLQRLAMGKYFQQMRICYQRFQHCSSLLHPAFCSSIDISFAFYNWAKQLADQILNADGTRCSNDMLRRFYTLQLVQQEQHGKNKHEKTA